MTTLDLFQSPISDQRESIGPCAFVLRGFALPYVDDLIPALADIAACSPFRNMVTPGGFTMSVALTNCGPLGWTTDRHGYRYTALDPDSGKPWPAMPNVFAALAREAPAAVGFRDFHPDACLVNRYLPGSRLSLQEDRNELDLVHRLFRCRWACPPLFCSVVMRARTRRPGFRCTTGTWQFGAVRTDCAITA